MIWILILLFAPVLLLLYVVYLMIKFVVILMAGFIYFLLPSSEARMGELDPVTGKVKW